MFIELDKEDLISLVMGKEPITMDGCDSMGRLMDYTGNQYNPSWGWNRDELSSLSEENLYKLYTKLKNKEV